MTDPPEPHRIASATVEVAADTSALTRTARIIARHLTAMADELDGVGGHPFLGEELPPDAGMPAPCGEDCREHRLHARGPGGLYPAIPLPAGTSAADAYAYASGYLPPAGEMPAPPECPE
jgi:hypothetical protein